MAAPEVHYTAEDMPDSDTCSDCGHPYCEECERYTWNNSPYGRYDNCGLCDTPYPAE